MARSYFPQNTGSVWFWNLNLSVLLLLERRILQVHVSVDCTLDDLIRQVWCSLSVTDFCFSVEFIYLQWLKPKTGPGHDNSSLQTLCSSVVTNYSMWMCNKVWWSPCWFQMVASWYMCFLGFSCLKLAYFVCFGNWLYWMLSVFTPDLFSFLLVRGAELHISSTFPSIHRKSNSVSHSFPHDFVFLSTNHFNDYKY